MVTLKCVKCDVWCSFVHLFENSEKMSTSNNYGVPLGLFIVGVVIGIPLVFGMWYGLYLPSQSYVDSVISRTCIVQQFSITTWNCTQQKDCRCGGCEANVPTCQQRYQFQTSGLCCGADSCCSKTCCSGCWDKLCHTCDKKQCCTSYWNTCCSKYCCSFSVNTCWLYWGTCFQMDATLRFATSLSRKSDNFTRSIKQTCSLNDFSCVTQWKNEFGIVSVNQFTPFLCYDDGNNILLSAPSDQPAQGALAGFSIGLAFCALAALSAVVGCCFFVCHKRSLVQSPSPNQSLLDPPQLGADDYQSTTVTNSPMSCPPLPEKTSKCQCQDQNDEGHVC